MFLASHRIIPPKEWIHKPELQSYDGKTVAILLKNKQIIIPEEW